MSYRPIKHVLALMVSILLVNCPPGAAQEAQPQSGHGIYVSGFMILKPGKNPNNVAVYATGMLFKVREKWYARIPTLPAAVGLKQGIVLIDLKIERDGSLGGINTTLSAGDASLDDAATQAITASAPFARLPNDYPDKDLHMRMKFGYGQSSEEAIPICDGPNWGAHPASYEVHKIVKGITPPKATYSPDPEYSDEARREKYMSLIYVGGTVDPEGGFTDLCVTQAAGDGLDQKALDEVRTWKFEPGTMDGKPVAVRLLVELTFHLY